MPCSKVEIPIFTSSDTVAIVNKSKYNIIILNQIRQRLIQYICSYTCVLNQYKYCSYITFYVYECMQVSLIQHKTIASHVAITSAMAF